eukprot:gnl/TRDRNA2_/TRDRNA2_156615_c3_seq1.p1 gnl/TRDRNA2_/TRDRNA2_156615_c3~~gnl/TRDRNA2_/TRDRNA2_156615_c3_seq1.p1  ORF type:complete len:336 (-),score=62.44 gnl/TRDRNA2_/TRDRNA2_156615_c3_seq1:125-1051(-)
MYEETFDGMDAVLALAVLLDVYGEQEKRLAHMQRFGMFADYIIHRVNEYSEFLATALVHQEGTSVGEFLTTNESFDLLDENFGGLVHLVTNITEPSPIFPGVPLPEKEAPRLFAGPHAYCIKPMPGGKCKLQVGWFARREVRPERILDGASWARWPTGFWKLMQVQSVRDSAIAFARNGAFADAFEAVRARMEERFRGKPAAPRTRLEGRLARLDEEDEESAPARPPSPVRVERVYLVDNSRLHSNTRGLMLRECKDVEAKGPRGKGRTAPWGSKITGVDEGDGWVRVGTGFMPMRIKGILVLTLQAR